MDPIGSSEQGYGRARLEEIRDERAAATGIPFGTNAIAARAEVTAESLIGKVQTLYDRALESGQLSAGVSAVKEMSILTGHRIERREVGPPDSFDHLTDDELERALIERLKVLGLTLDVEEKAGAEQSAPDTGSDTRH